MMGSKPPNMTSKRIARRSSTTIPRYRNPPVPGPGWPAYRKGFRVGYERFLHPGPPPGY